MSKFLEFNLTYNLSELATNAIREKSDIIKLLLHAIRSINTNIEVQDKELGKMYIHISKMSRITFSINFMDGHYQKNFSFAFPFAIKINEEIEVYSVGNDIIIDSTIINVLLELAEENWFYEKEQQQEDMYEFLGMIGETNRAYEVDEQLEKKIWIIAKELFLFEPGYIRYDYDADPERLNPDSHPLHHIDLFFSSRATFKLGIEEAIISNRIFSANELMELLDSSTDCGFINYKKAR
ncbi:hypothetical protein ACFSR7_34500 [Cohnella sp. GCM10020058]|uniref:hypothetical protein n=1 Tax=Cohnella sp. GCM10020058 TaxID=3317330 RepID=UPI003639922C